MKSKEETLHFYETLTGVFNDEQSKIIRYTCFAVLFLGMLWAGYNYFRATVLADTNTPVDEDLFFDNTPLPANDSATSRIMEIAQTVDNVRRGSEAIASTIIRLNKMPFNLDPEGGNNEPFASPSTGTSSTAATNSGQQSEITAQPQPGSVIVRMIMLADDGEKLAVIDVGGLKGLVVRRGDMLPGGAVRIAAIKNNGITVIFNKQEFNYEVSEIHKYEISENK